MMYRVMADGLALLHLLFVCFVVLGGVLVLVRPRCAWLHLPAAAWGACIELTGWICPLTPIENQLRRLGGQAGYGGGFIEHYVLSLLYPDGLTRRDQLVLAGLVLAVNLGVYTAVLLRRRRNDPGAADTR
jgi:hypothetical protein